MTAFTLEPWRDFYVMIGTASGALIGASFIVVTLSANLASRAVGIRGFISPTAGHLGTVLIGSAILAIPGISGWAVAILLGLGGLVGAIYCSIVARRIWAMKLLIEDRLWYVLMPLAAYVIMFAAAVMIVLRIDSPLYVLAASLIVLLIAGMRNAWDMASFMILRPPDPPQ
ncbi:MAG TPA: hypothetical protein VLV55_07015 [Rhizomicrobium sp.]|nr:hypothetical protein [Rhizomicrobium sp.]